jgi:DNA topoisomerase-1
MILEANSIWQLSLKQELANGAGQSPGAALQSSIESARAVGLRYVSDVMPGITRRKSGHGFSYYRPEGKLVRDHSTLTRIKSLAVPPAWRDVWICLEPSGHLQATGRDDRGRKQHRYHPRWREVRDETKYARMIAFAKALPRIRRHVQADLKLTGLPRNKVLATVARLLEISLIRVGNDEYARENDSFGLTTMRNRHVDVAGSTVRFHFRGKSGKWHEVDIKDRRLARIIKSCQDLPGQELFQYVDEQGQRQDVRSGDVNDYLREISGEDFTAKDFRTWAGTVLSAIALREFEQFDSQAQAKKNLAQAIESVSKLMGNTTAVCRKCYVHPDVISCYLDGTLVEILKKNAERQVSRNARQLRPEEAAVLGLLEQRLAAEKRQKSLPHLLKQSIRTIKRRSRHVSRKTLGHRRPVSGSRQGLS